MHGWLGPNGLHILSQGNRIKGGCHGRYDRKGETGHEKSFAI